MPYMASEDTGSSPGKESLRAGEVGTLLGVSSRPHPTSSGQIRETAFGDRFLARPGEILQVINQGIRTEPADGRQPKFIVINRE